MTVLGQTKSRLYAQSLSQMVRPEFCPSAISTIRDQIFGTEKSRVTSKVLSRSGNRVDAIHTGVGIQGSDGDGGIADIEYLVKEFEGKISRSKPSAIKDDSAGPGVDPEESITSWGSQSQSG